MKLKHDVITLILIILFLTVSGTLMLAFGQTFFEASECSYMSINTTRSNKAQSWRFRFDDAADVLGGPGHNNPLRYVWDNSNEDAADGTSYGQQTAMLINVAGHTESDFTGNVNAGDIVTITFNNGTGLIYMPEAYVTGGALPDISNAYYYLATKWEADGYYYVSTYNDVACTSLAHSAPPSPTPTPSPTPSLVPTPNATTTPTAVPTASPVVSPTPTPLCVGATAYNIWDISGASIGKVRSTGDIGWRIRFLTDTTSLGDIYDSANHFIDGNIHNGALKIQVTQLNQAPRIRAGDYVTFTDADTGSPVNVFFTAVTDSQTFYVDEDGRTYTDSTLCTLAGDIVTTPSPAASPTSTPVTTDCLTLVSYPYTAEETSIYSLLNDDFGAILDYANNYCFRTPIGYGDMGSNIVGKDQMRDSSVGSDEAVDFGFTGTDIALDTIQARNIKTGTDFAYNDVFDETYDVRLPFRSEDATYETSWQLWVYPYWSQFSEMFAIRKIDSSGNSEGTPLVIEPENQWIGLANDGIPTADVDIGGDVRIQGKLTIDEAIIQQWTAFSGEDTTPNVGNGTRFYTNNTGATAISDFDGAVSGHEFYLWIADANTTWSATTGNINFVTASSSSEDELYRFLRRGDQWYEVGHYDYGSYAGVDDLLAFDGFENGQKGGDGNWSGAWSATRPWYWRTNDPYAGSYAVLLGKNGSISRGVNTGSGTATISVWTKVYQGSPILYIYDSANNSSWVELTHLTCTGGYTQRSVSWTLETSVTPEYIKLKNGSAGASYLWLDNIKIE